MAFNINVATLAGTLSREEVEEMREWVFGGG
jgi:hypothetical protein